MDKNNSQLTGMYNLRVLNKTTMQQLDPKCQISLRDYETRYQCTRVNRQVTGKEVRHLAEAISYDNPTMSRQSPALHTKGVARHTSSLPLVTLVLQTAPPTTSQTHKKERRLHTQNSPYLYLPNTVNNSICKSVYDVKLIDRAE